MEDFNQVMMDQLLEQGLRLGEPPLFGHQEVICNGRPVNAFAGDLSLEITSRPPDRWRVVHDYALDALDLGALLGAVLPDHSIWLEPEFTRIVVPMAYYSHVRRVTLVAGYEAGVLLNSEALVS